MGNDPDIVDISSEITADNSSQTGPDKVKSEPVTVFRTKKNRKWIIWLIILAVIAGIIAFAVIKVRNAAEKLKEAMESQPQEATITRMDITSSISTTGTIQSKDVRTLTSALSGVKIEEVNYKVGDMVEQHHQGGFPLLHEAFHHGHKVLIGNRSHHGHHTLVVAGGEFVELLYRHILEGGVILFHLGAQLVEQRRIQSVLQKHALDLRAAVEGLYHRAQSVDYLLFTLGFYHLL